MTEGYTSSEQKRSNSTNAGLRYSATSTSTRITAQAASTLTSSIEVSQLSSSDMMRLDRHGMNDRQRGVRFTGASRYVPTPDLSTSDHSKGSAAEAAAAAASLSDQQEQQSKSQHQQQKYHHRDQLAPTTTGTLGGRARQAQPVRQPQRQRPQASAKPQAQPARQPQRQRPQQQDSAKHQPQQKPRRVWKEAVDPKSGRTYYYDVVTRETQWRKPLELATSEERRAIQEKERKQKDFFSAMEANILRCMQNGQMPGGPAKGAGGDDSDADSFDEGSEAASKMLTPSGSAPLTSIETRPSGGKKGKGGLLPKSSKPAAGPVRTISMMGENTIAELVGGDGSNKSKSKGQPKSASPDSVAAFPLQSGVVPIRTTTPSGAAGATPAVAHGHHAASAPAALGHRRSGSDGSQDRAIEQVRRAADQMTRSSGGDEWSPLVGDNLIDSEASSRRQSVESGSESNGVVVPPPKVGDLKKVAKPTLANRNTCGTIHVGSTMSVPDKDATIKCVCGVFRAHMLQAAKDEAATGFRPPVRFDEYEIFNDRPSDRRSNASPPRPSQKRGGVAERIAASFTAGPFVVSQSGLQSGIEALSLESVESAVPSLDDITAFYRDVFRRSQMETDCIIMSLIYVERLIKATNGGVRPRVGNWRSVLFASMVMSSKVWDDLSMWNADFSQACPAGVRFTLRRINELELAMLGCLKFSVKVPASEYAKYYFLLRSMMIRSGLAGDDLSSMTPLDVEGARKLEVMSSKFQPAGEGDKIKAESLKNLRSKSVGEVEEMIGAGGGARRSSSPKGIGGVLGSRVNLEHVVNL